MIAFTAWPLAAPWLVSNLDQVRGACQVVVVSSYAEACLSLPHDSCQCHDLPYNDQQLFVHTQVDEGVISHAPSPSPTFVHILLDLRSTSHGLSSPAS